LNRIPTDAVLSTSIRYIYYFGSSFGMLQLLYSNMANTFF
jgi:hypothetical protein